MGSATAMAAGALVEIAGGTPEQVGHAGNWDWRYCRYPNWEKAKRTGLWQKREVRQLKYTSAFEIIGPIMVGPSSSHTVGAVRIGNLARQIMGE